MESLGAPTPRHRRLRNFDAPEAWVRRVAMNLAADPGRRAASPGRPGPPRPGGAGPAVQVEDLALLEALRGLPIHHRQVIVLHHLLGMPVQEVAAALQVPTGTVKTRLARGRRTLAAQLTERGEEVPSHQ
jgi:RNA polymerase sigma-70 factor (ECF subfamily)